jgi:hypothetical protein
MDDVDRTGTPTFEAPDHLLPRLRAAAEDELERACDNGGEWDEHIRARVLDAARMVETSTSRRSAPRRSPPSPTAR